jgi:hypothetical protein
MTDAPREPPTSWRDRLNAQRETGRLFAETYGAAAADVVTSRKAAMERGADSVRATWQSASAMVKDVDALGAANCGLKWAGVAKCLRDDATSPLDCLAKLPKESQCYEFVQRIVDRVQPVVDGLDAGTSERCAGEWDSVHRCIEAGGGRACVAQVPRDSKCYHYVVDRWARDQMKKLPLEFDAEAALKCGVRWVSVAACLGVGGNFTCLAGIPQDSACYAFVDAALGRVRDNALEMELMPNSLGL